jgi:Flp pilus assembly protein TadD
MSQLLRQVDTKLGLLALLLILTALVYTPSLQNEYGVDAKHVINDRTNAGLDSLGVIFTELSNKTEVYDREDHRYEIHKHKYRPIGALTFALTAALFGGEPPPVINHAINLGIFLLLLYLMWQYMVPLWPDRWGGRYMLFAGLLLYAIHPVNTEVVLSLKNREVMLAALFALLSLRVYERFAQKVAIGVPPLRQGLWYAAEVLLAAALAFLALLTKPSVFPLLITVYGALLVLQFQGPRLRWGVLLALVLFVGLSGYIIAQLSPPRPYAVYENPAVAFTHVGQHIAMAGQAMAGYFKLAVWPHPLRYYYGLGTGFTGSWDLAAVLGWALWAGLTAWGALLWFRRRWASLLLLIPMAYFFASSNLLIKLPGVIAERFMFVPLALMALGAVTGGYRLLYAKDISVPPRLRQRARRFVPVIYILVLAGFTGLTLYRIPAWADMGALYARDIPHLKGTYFQNIEYAERIAKQAPPGQLPPQKVEKALRYARRAHRALPVRERPLFWLGSLHLTETRNQDSALYYFRKAQRLHPSSFYTMQLGEAFELAGKPDSAAYYYEQGYLKNPKNMDFARIAYQFALEQGDTARARRINQHLADAYPESLQPLRNRARLQLSRGDTAQAVKLLQRAYQRDSTDQGLRRRLRQLQK